VVDGAPPRLALSEADIQPFLDRRRPGQSKFVTQRQEADQVRILSGVFEGQTTGTPIALMIENTDQRSKDYGEIKDRFRPGHADIAYELKYGIRDYRGGGRSSARETAMRVAAGAIARKWLSERHGVEVRGHLSQLGPIPIGFRSWDAVANNPFFSADPAAVPELEAFMDRLRKSGDSVGAKITVVTHAFGVDFLMEGMKDRNENPFSATVAALVARGVKFEVCEITLQNRNLKREQFIQEAEFTPSGVVRLARLQKQGASYIKP
jgi:chorismate synthase